jgi:MYXO-CTERM domain-containing protein
MLLSLFLLPVLHAQEVIVDDQDGSPGFTTTGDDWTTWGTNGYGFDGGDSEYHYLSHTVGGEDRRGTATWSPDLPQEGTYEIAAWYRLTENRSRDADHVVRDGTGATTKKTLDQYGDGASGWVTLGEHWCASGRGGCTVTLDGTDDDESDEANAMRFTWVDAGGTDEPDPDPDDALDDCGEFPGLGAHTQVAYASELDAVDWEDKNQAKGSPDGLEANTPNVDAGEHLTAWGWALCDPVGEETLDSVRVEVYARTQYDSGSYEVELRLDGDGTAATIFNGTNLAWHGVDVTGDLGSWTWADADATRGRVTLHDHPQGNRDSDAWVDAWRLTVAFTTTADEGSDSSTEPVDTGEPGDAGDDQIEDPAPVDSAWGDTGDSGGAGRPGDPYYTEGSEAAAGCGCSSTAPAGLTAWLIGLVALLRRRKLWSPGLERVLMN